MFRLNYGDAEWADDVVIIPLDGDASRRLWIDTANGFAVQQVQICDFYGNADEESSEWTWRHVGDALSSNEVNEMMEELSRHAVDKGAVPRKVC